MMMMMMMMIVVIVVIMMIMMIVMIVLEMCIENKTMMHRCVPMDVVVDDLDQISMLMSLY